MGDRDHRAVFGDSFQGIEDFFLGLGIQVGCDLVEEKKVRFCGCGSRDGEELPLTLGEKLRRADCIVTFFQTLDGPGKACERSCGPHLFLGNFFIIKGDLIPDGSRHHVEGLLHIAKKLSSFLCPHCSCRQTVDQHLSLIRLVKSKQQL